MFSCISSSEITFATRIIALNYLAHSYEKAKVFADKDSDRQKALFHRKSKDLSKSLGIYIWLQKLHGSPDTKFKKVKKIMLSSI